MTQAKRIYAYKQRVSRGAAKYILSAINCCGEDAIIFFVGSPVPHESTKNRNRTIYYSNQIRNNGFLVSFKIFT